MSARAAPSERGPLGLAQPRAYSIPRVRADASLTIGVAAVLAVVAFRASGGLSLGPSTEVELGLTLGTAAVMVPAILSAPPRGALHGAWATGFFLALAGITALSVVWSVQPSDSWLEASRTLSYAAAFALAITLVRLAPERWPAVLGGIVLAGVVVCGYALATKVEPGHLNSDEIYARLRQPYGYWNAIGLTAALAAVPCLWLGARRAGHAALSALAYPALGLLLVTLMLAYSRGALLALALGCACWFVIVPLRLRGAAVLGVGALGAGTVVIWAFAQAPLTKDRVPLSTRAASGHQLGILLVIMVVVLLGAGLAIGFASSRRAPGPDMRRKAGVALLAALALVPVVLAGALTFSQRGLLGSISHGVNSLTDPHARVPSNDPGRLTAIGSVRARYWNEALKTWKDKPILGTGAGGYATARLRYRADTLDVRHAHGYVVQTLADLGLLGMALSLALAGAWLVAALRPTRPHGWLLAARSRAPWLTGERAEVPYTPERIGLLTMLAVVVVFTVHSLVDWTWFIPGGVCVALLCAGWLAGRGRLGERPGTDPAAGGRAAGGSSAGGDSAGRDSAERGAAVHAPAGTLGPRLERWRDARAWRALGRPRAALAAAVLGLALVAAWAEWQPQRSVNAASAALTALEHQDPRGAQVEVQRAIDRNPLSVDPLFDLAVIQEDAGQPVPARATLERAVRLQPANPATWLRLADFDLNAQSAPRQALTDARAALYLDPESREAQTLFLEISRALSPVAVRPPAPGPAAAPRPLSRQPVVPSQALAPGRASGAPASANPSG